MTRGRMSPAVILALVALLGFCLGAIADQPEKPVTITKQLSPNVPEQTPDPNWELKEQMGVVEDPGSSVPDFDPLGKRGPRKGPAPPASKAGYLTEGFEAGVVPPAGWGAVVNNPFTWEIDDYNPCEGVYNASCYYDETYVGTQDEWLTSPVIDLEGATADVRLEFCFLASYYWSVDPYDNCDLSVWISTDAGASFPTLLWDESALGVFENWTWYDIVVDLSSYMGEKDVVIGFQYYGYDGAQMSIDAISVNDDPPPSGRCCYGDPLAPSCATMSQVACEALGDFISWDEGLDCTEACPVAGPGDNCSNPVDAGTFPAGLPYTNTNYTCGRGNDYESSDMCYTYGYGGGEDIVYEFVVTEEIQVTMTMDPKGTTWTYVEVRDDCIPPNGNCIFYFRNTGSDAYSSGLQTLTAGTYYMIIDSWPSPDCIPDFDISIELFAGGATGDDCTDPIVVKIPDDMPYTTTDATCGRFDYYDATCLGSYDGGEDIIYELDVTGDIAVDITLDPKGTTWTGIGIGTSCPLGDPCIATSTSSSSSPHGLTNISLSTGTYYIQIDTWPSPDCIPDFDLTITQSAGGPANDNCVDAEKIGDVVDLAFSTAAASFDGGGSCMYSPNIWYCYEATCDGMATFSLCGSSYDTKIAVYDGCTCEPLGTELGCNDDACGLQSQLMLPVVAGQEYLIEVGGYGSNTGTGVLNVGCDPGGDPPPNDNCADVTPVTLVSGVETTFTGNNEYATSDCPDLAPATEAWEAFTTESYMDVTIDYCGTSPSFELVYIILSTACPCDPEFVYATSTNWDLCGDGNVTMYFPGLPAGTYYIPVLAFHPDYPTEYYAGDYTIHVNGVTVEPDYCDASGGCDEYIANVTVAGINNSSSCEGYGDFTGQIATMTSGSSNPITITIGNAYSSDYGAVWVDWNQDLDFDDAGEQIGLEVDYGYGPYTGTITVPGDATEGLTRMRVRLSYALPPGPCGTTSYGEAEDYSVLIGTPSELTIDPESIAFGPVPSGATGSAPLTLGAVGGAPINFDIEIEYLEKNSVGGGECDPTLRTSPFESEGFVAATEKAPNQLLYEGFEGTVPPAGWTLESNNPYTWEIGTYAPYEGSQYATCYYDETYSGDQEEYLITPTLDLAGKYVLDFWWNGSYYWSVDPYDNCDLQVWISIDGGSTWLTELWNSDNVGEFANWEWYNAVVDLSAFSGESNVKLAFVYVGYDGAQFSVDAVGINPAPLSWLDVNPSSGSIPGSKGTVEVTVSYDATDLELGLYEANLAITHSGTKALDNVPVSLLVSDEAPLEIDPWPIYALYAFSMDPMVGHIFVREDDLGEYPGYTLADIDPGTFEINGSEVPVSSWDFPAESFFDVSFDVGDFIESYPLMWDIVDQPYTIGGSFTDATTFLISRTVECIGHVSGDANLDGQANVGDAVFLINHVFKDGAAPRLEATADANCDGAINVADAVRLVNYVFRNGAAPCHP